jgi:hypothetical protein
MHASLSALGPGDLSGDGRLLFAAYGVRLFAYGALSVALGPHLAALGLGPAAIGAILTSVARMAGAALAPALAGATPAAPALGLPFYIAGGLKITDDLSMLAAFRDVKPPEEAGRVATPSRGRIRSTDRVSNS